MGNDVHRGGWRGGEFGRGKLAKVSLVCHKSVKGLRLTSVALVIVPFKALCLLSTIHSVATCSFAYTPVEGGLTMAMRQSV